MTRRARDDAPAATGDKGYPFVRATPEISVPNAVSPTKRLHPKSLGVRTHKHRHVVKPWRFLLLILVSLAFHGWPGGRWWMLLSVLGLGVLVAVAQWFRRKRAAFRAYALVCTLAATLWTMWTIQHGLWGDPGKYSPIMFLAAWLPLSWLWWERHRTRIHVAATPPDEDEDPFLTKWNSRVEPELHWVLDGRREIDAGDAYRLQLVPGQAIEDAREARRKVASLLRMDRRRLSFEPLPGDGPGDSGDESLIQLILTPTRNPHQEDQTWHGPTLDKATGLYKHGVYPDAAAFLRLFQTEDGVPHRAKNGLWSGATGFGKSRGLAIKIAEHLLSQMFCVWYADGKEGASAPELEDRVDWYATSVVECERMLRAAWRVMKVRKLAVKLLNQAAFRGEKVIYLGSLAFPMLQIILDEAQEFLRVKVIARLVKAILRMGNEVGMGMDLATQVPLLAELGAESGDGGAEVIRGMAKSGNLVVYRAEDGFTGTVTVNADLKVDPKTLPKEPGWCFVASHTVRGSACKTYYVSKGDLFEWLRDVPVVTLEEASARAAGEDYATRHQRAEEDSTVPEDIDLADLDAELAILLGEALPGQPAPGGVAEQMTVRQAVFNAVRDNRGVMERKDVIAAVAAQGKQASDSAVAQALAWWKDQGHMESAGHGRYDLISREGQDEQVPAGASI